MEDIVKTILNDYGSLVYLVTVVWTFLEGETFVIIVGALASSGDYEIKVWLVVLCATLGSFCGDQFYYYIGRHYGAPLLARWPNLRNKIDWAFKMVRQNETLFILSFRFIYGVRNISPFVIGIAGVSRLKYFVLNLIAASIWANSFGWGGYLLGKALEQWLGQHKLMILAGFILFFASIAFINYLIQRRKAIAAEVPEDRQPANSDLPPPPGAAATN